MRPGLTRKHAPEPFHPRRPGVLRKLLRRVRTRVLKPVRAAKLLGVAFGGGRRRSTVVIQHRLKQFRDKTAKVRQLRRQRLSAVQYVRTAGIPSLLYGADTTGVADSTIDRVRASAAAMVAPQGAGKNPPYRRSISLDTRRDS